MKIAMDWLTTMSFFEQFVVPWTISARSMLQEHLISLTEIITGTLIGMISLVCTQRKITLMLLKGKRQQSKCLMNFLKHLRGNKINTSSGDKCALHNISFPQDHGSKHTVRQDFVMRDLFIFRINAWLWSLWKMLVCVSQPRNLHPLAPLLTCYLWVKGNVAQINWLYGGMRLDSGHMHTTYTLLRNTTQNQHCDHCIISYQT